MQENASGFKSISFAGHLWRILDTNGSHALLLCCDSVLESSYHNRFTEVTWDSSDLRVWLNTIFFQKFSEHEKASVIDTLVQTEDSRYGSKGGNTCIDKVFCLSVEEAKRLLPSNASRACGTRWWLRTPGIEPKRAVCVRHDGYINDHGWGAQRTNGVRPALWIDLDIYQEGQCNA